MRHRMKSIYSNLSADKNRSALAAMHLLTQIISTSTATAREFAQHFDFGFKGLPRLAKARIPKGSASASKPSENGSLRHPFQSFSQRRSHILACLSSALRRQFIRFCVAFLRTGDVGIIGSVVRKGLLGHLWRDLPHESFSLANELLPVLHQTVLLNSLLPNKLKQYVRPQNVHSSVSLLLNADGPLDLHASRRRASGSTPQISMCAWRCEASAISLGLHS